MGYGLFSWVHPSATVKLIQFNVGVERVIRLPKKPITVAEVMLDYPNHFLCSWRSSAETEAEKGYRVVALPAEEELECGNAYLLLPMKRLRCVLSPVDMRSIRASLHHHHKKNKNRMKMSSSSSKVVPFSEEASANVVDKKALPRLEVDEFAQRDLERMRSRRGLRWQPVLDTIQETRSFEL